MRSHTRVLVSLLGLLLTGSVMASGGNNEGDAAASLPEGDMLLAGPMTGLGDALRPAVLRNGDEWLRLYSTREGRVVFARGDDEPQTLDDEAAAQGGASFKLVQDDERLYAFWWTKLKDATKRLYVRVSDDGGESFGPLKTINTDGQVLGDYSVHVYANGELVVTYTDERAPRYQIYMNRTTDGAETWLSPDVRLDTARLPSKEQVTAAAKAGPDMFSVGSAASESRIVRTGDRLVVLWKEGRRDLVPGAQISRVVLRYSDDGGATWSDVVAVHERQNRPAVADEAITVMDDGSLVVAVFDYPEGLLTYRSTDGGATWEALSALPGSNAYLAFSQFETQAHGDRVTYVYSVDRRKKKPQVHTATLDVKTGEWLTPESVWIGEKPFEEQQSWNPALGRLASGQLVAVWEDYRAIRPGVRVKVSDDGVNWGGEGFLSLHEPGKYVEGWPRIRDADGDAPYVTFFRWEDDGRRKRNLFAHELPLGEDGRVAIDQLHEMASGDTEARKARLEERVKGFWEARVQARHADVYQYFDPTYRAGTTEIGFMASQGHIIYKSFELKEALVWDTIGGAVVNVQFEVPDMFVEGEEFSVPLTTDEYRQEWVWVYDDWYAVFETGVGTRYLQY